MSLLFFSCDLDLDSHGIDIQGTRIFGDKLLDLGLDGTHVLDVHHIDGLDLLHDSYYGLLRQILNEGDGARRAYNLSFFIYPTCEERFRALAGDVSLDLHSA